MSILQTMAFRLLTLTLAALLLRLIAIGWMLPQLPEPDVNIVAQARYVTLDSTERDPTGVLGKYPHLLPRLLHPWLPDGEPAAGPVLADQLAEAGAPIRAGRILVAVLAVLAVPGTFWFTRLYAGPGAALRQLRERD